MANLLNIEASNIVMVNGSTELITWIDKPDRIWKNSTLLPTLS